MRIDFFGLFSTKRRDAGPARRPSRDEDARASVNQETRKVGVAISHSAFPVRKTFNQRGLRFCFPSYLVGDRVASFGCATKPAVVNCDCCQQPLVGSSSYWGSLMRIVETMQKADWAAIISRVAGI